MNAATIISGASLLSTVAETLPLARRCARHAAHHCDTAKRFRISMPDCVVSLRLARPSVEVGVDLRNGAILVSGCLLMFRFHTAAANAAELEDRGCRRARMHISWRHHKLDGPGAANRVDGFWLGARGHVFVQVYGKMHIADIWRNTTDRDDSRYLARVWDAFAFPGGRSAEVIRHDTYEHASEGLPVSHWPRHP